MRATAVVLFNIIACRHAPEAVEAPEPPNPCTAVSLAAYPTKVDGVLIEEEEYRHLVKEVIEGVDERLPRSLSALEKFQRIDVGGQCAAGMRLETKLLLLIHDHREFHLTVEGRLLDCGSGALLHRFEVREDNSTVSAIPERLADAIASQVNDAECPMSTTAPPAAL